MSADTICALALAILLLLALFILPKS